MYCNNQRASFTAVRKAVGARQAGRYGGPAGTVGGPVRPVSAGIPPEKRVTNNVC